MFSNEFCTSEVWKYFRKHAHKVFSVFGPLSPVSTQQIATLNAVISTQMYNCTRICHIGFLKVMEISKQMVYIEIKRSILLYFFKCSRVRTSDYGTWWKYEFSTVVPKGDEVWRQVDIWARYLVDIEHGISSIVWHCKSTVPTSGDMSTVLSA